MAALKSERIKDQMVNTAARIWRIEESEIEHTFDPLALLLIEACAAEMEKIGYEISSSHTRLLDYLAEIVLPESLFGSIPASGIVQAMPVDTKAEIGLNDAFYLSQKIQRPVTGKSENIDLHLCPIGKFTLLNTDMAYLVSGNKLFRIKENNSKELLFSPDRSVNSNELWLLLNTDKTLQDLQYLSIYFDLRSHSAAAAFYNALSYSKSWLHESAVDICSGYGADKEFGINQREILLSGDSRTNKINRKTGYIYQNRFLQITGATKITKAGLPAGLQDKFPDEISKQLEAEQLTYLKIELPQYFSQEVFDIITCSVNAFPVINKKMNSFNYRTDDWINIIPVPADGTFFDLAAVKNEKGEQYKIRPAAGVDSIAAGEVIVRTSGVGKTSSQEVREMINNITETIRDQSAYFGQLSNEFVLSKLREIAKLLAGLEDNMMAATDKKAAYNYLMLRPGKNGEMISVDYWITNGTDANTIKAGHPVFSVNNTLINTKKSHTLTSFSGGKNSVNETEKKNILRQQLISGGKIVSAEDVKLLCIQLFGDRLKKVEIKKGVQVGSKSDEGFKRTIDVILTYSTAVNESMKNEMDNVCRELEFILKKNASPVVPFQIIVNSKQ
jgi:hypothetical protein